MRWWLAAIFVLIAALTAVIVATVSSRQADHAVRSNAEDVAVGKTVSAGFVVERAIAQGDLADAVAAAATRRDMALFVFAPGRRLLTAEESRGIHWRSVPGGSAALTEALSGHRFVSTSTGSGATLVALPLRRTTTAAALVAFAPQASAYGVSLSIFHREVARAALWSGLIAAAAGVLAAALIARRLRRIGAAAAAIERGTLDTPLPPGFPDEVGALAVTIDRMRRRLRTSFVQLSSERDRLARLLEQLHEGVVAVDDSGAVQFANAAATSWLGRAALTPGEILPESWAGVPLRGLVQSLFRPDAVVAEARATTEDARTLSIAGIPASGSELAVIVIADITERERHERSEREFVANASHELRTPVSAIVSAVDALQAGAKDVPADRDMFVDLIDRQAARLTRLTRSLLLLARAQSDEDGLPLEPVDLAPVIRQVAEATGQPDAKVAIDCPPSLVALAQRDVVEQVIGNLVGNALRHSNGAPVRVRAKAGDGMVSIEVADDGPGISQAAQRHIFDRFYSGGQGKRDGFGLGLAIVRDAVRALGGRVVVDSRLGAGTTVTVTLAQPSRR
jgi:two-component system phosphate regulon sensor histidine kinase PhoR